MLILKNNQLTIWEQILPKEVQILPEELKRVDKLLDDERFFKPYVDRFNTRIGRPTVSVETYIRMMYLKYRYQLGYETLEREVSDSISWRIFCRIGLEKDVPHSTTLIKLTKKYEAESVEKLNNLLLEKAREQKLIRGRKLRIDTTVIESDIHHPTDARLLQDSVKVITRMVKKIKDSGAAIRTKFQDRNRSVKRKALNIAKIAKRRTGEAIKEIDKVTEKIIAIAEKTVKEAAGVLKNANRKLWRDGKEALPNTKLLAEELSKQLQMAQRIIDQSKEVVSGNRKIPDRVISIYDTDARPIKKGKPQKPTEFGYKVLIQETEDGIVTGYEVYCGNPSDDTLLQSALEKHRELFGKAPWGIAGDRGFGSKANEELCEKAGVKRISLPKKGKLSKKQWVKEKQPALRRLQRFRAGIEARISLLKRKYGLRRSLLRGRHGTETWVGSGVFAYNLQKLASMA